MMKQMSKTLKAGAALLMAGSLVFAVNGCSDTTWGAECDGVRMPAGVYINNVISAYSTAVGELTEDADTDNIWKNTLDGVDLHTWVQNKALENVRNYFAVEQKFDEMGLTMDEETLSQAQSLAQYQWSYYQSSYEKNGVSEQSFTETIVNSYKNSMIFNAIYGEGGTQEVSDQELLDRFNEQYASIDRIYIPLAGEDGNTTQESIDAAREKAEGYQQRMENGESIADLAKEYANEQAVANGEETSDDPVNTSSLISYETSGYSETFTEAVRGAEKGKPIVIEDDANMCLVVVNEVTTDSDLFLTNRSYLLSDLKGEEYENTVTEWGNALTVTFNDAAVKRYDIKKLDIV